ncbi:MAG: enoyl-CoA hydratase/isomerase family protein [Sphingobium sp.]
MIALTQADGIARIDIARPAVRNALDRSGWRQLADAVHAAGVGGARVLILASGVDGAFCAGSHLEEMAALAGSDAGKAPFRAMMRDALDPLARLSIPTLAAIDGDCFGAGVAVALACDIRIAGSHARFCVPPARLGVSYPPEDVARLVACVGRGQAGLMLYGAAVVDGAEAVRIGLAERLVDDVLGEAMDIAARIAGNAPASVALLKRIVTGAADAVEANAGFDRLMDGDALQEGLRAFRERRAPRF